MRRHVKWLLTAILAGLVVSPAIAQILQGMTPLLNEGLGAPFLLMNKGVQKEIELTDDQREKFASIIQEVHNKYQPDLQKARQSGDGKRFLAVLRDSTQESRDKVDKAIPDVLKPEQAKRLKEIEIQVNGVLSLEKPEVQKELKLTTKQKNEIKHIGDGLKRDIAAVVKDAASQPLRKGRDAPRKVRDLKNDATSKALEKLNDEQKKKWDALIGDKFELKLDTLSLPGRG